MTTSERFVERWQKEGIRVHNNDYVVVGDYVQAIRDVKGRILKGKVLRVSELIIEPPGTEKGNAIKRLKFEGVEDEYNPQRFVKVD